ncbi:MAG: DUF58 domain-containing protein [Phycisphaerales bacterium]
MLAPRDNTHVRTMEQLLPHSLSARLDALDLLSRKVLSGKLPGERRSKRRGRSVEFDDFRQYVPGDDLRHIDWNILGRLDRLFVKLFREEEDLSLTVLVDASPSMNVGTPCKLVYALQLAMAMGYIGLVNQNRVSAAVFGVPTEDGEDALAAGLRRLAPMRGRMNTRRLAEFLLGALQAAQRRSVAPGLDPGATFDDAVRALARADSSSLTTGTRGITLVISDFLLPRPPDSLRLIAGSPTLDTYAVQILSPGELDPGTLAEEGLVGDLRLTDVETARAQEVTVTPATIALYRRALDRSVRALHDQCARLAIGHVLISTATPVEDVVTSTLRRGGLLR